MTALDYIVGAAGLVLLIPLGIVMLGFAALHVARNLLTTGRCWE